VRAGGRSERVRLEVARACLDLLAAGRADFGPGEVAQRSGVSRATIHRWWPTKADLLREALTLHTRSLDVPDTGSWAGDVHALARQLAVFFREPVEVAQNAIMASGAHPEYTEAVLRHYDGLFAGWRGVVERARARGEVRTDVDADTVVLTLASPLVLVPLLFRRSPSPGEVERIATLVVAATST
jgi:AcrR family transcriptional regulator